MTGAHQERDPHIEKAMALRNEIPMTNNCAQTLMRVYAAEIGLTEEQAAAIGCNFGGGMKCGGLCGVITGGYMILGARGVTDPKILRQFRDRIAGNHGGLINCSDLLRANAERGGVKKEHCDGMIREAIEAIDDICTGQDS